MTSLTEGLKSVSWPGRVGDAREPRPTRTGDAAAVTPAGEPALNPRGVLERLCHPTVELEGQRGVVGSGG